MDPIWQWGLDVIRFVQQIQHPAVDVFFEGVTFLGNEPFFLVFLPTVFWCINFDVGARLGVTVLLSTYLNVSLKDLFMHPRPFEIDPSVQRYDTYGFGLPSGHAQTAVVMWGVLAAEIRRRWAWVIAIVLMVLIGFSRIYLGVHFPTDVLLGWIVGVLVLGLYVWREREIESWLARRSIAAQLALAAGVPLVLVLLHASENTVISMGVLLGLGIGGVLAVHFVPFTAEGPLWQRVLRFVVGVIGLLALYVGLKAVFPAEGERYYALLRFVRYAITGFWGALGAPWVFKLLGIAGERGLSEGGE